MNFLIYLIIYMIFLLFPLSTFCCLFTFVTLIFTACFSPDSQVNLRVSTNGHCLSEEICDFLDNCTVLHGNLVLRKITQHKIVNTRKPNLRRLKEITGFLVITFFGEVADYLPSLSVIRGKNLVGNYAFVVYFNSITKFIYFPNLTTILNGGVRISMNKILCYVSTVRWKSIVKVCFKRNNV